MIIEIEWVELPAELIPNEFLSVLVAGILGDEMAPAVHEGFWNGREWCSIRRLEYDPDKFMRLNKVTHYALMPKSPNPLVNPK